MTGQPTEPGGVAAPRGRPRDGSRDVAIHDAVLGLLTEVGYDRMSVESVAGRAGVGKTTVYRRYRDKAALVAAAVDRRGAGAPPDTRSDEPRDALLRTLAWLADEIGEQQVGLIGALFAGMRSDPELAAAMRRIRLRDIAAMTEHLPSRAAGLFAELAPALVVHRLVVLGEPCDRPFLEHVVDDVLLPLLHHPTSPERQS